jgi:hypothetical protein
MKKVIGLLFVGAMVLTLAGATASSARTAAPGAVIKSGACSDGSSWTLTLKQQEGQIKSIIAVQTSTAGQRWHFSMKDNGMKFGSGLKWSAADGSWSATGFAADQAGTDNVVVRANNRFTDETCTAKAAI